MTLTPLEIALERIEECRRTRSTELDLSKLGLEEIPELVFELTWLERLDVSGEEFKGEGATIKLPSSIILQIKQSSEFILQLDKFSKMELEKLKNALNQEGYEQKKIRSIPSSIKKLTSLKEFVCSFNNINSLSSLSDLPQLQYLICQENHISDLSPLNGLAQLKSLICGRNLLSDLSPLINLSHLQTLSCSENQISDLSPLSNLSKLQSLTCYSNQISDLSPLNGLSQLRLLDCMRNEISELLSLNGLYQLQSLKCSANKISDISPLGSLSNLQLLSCNENRISDLSPLSSLSRLQSLTCWDNCISNLSPLKKLLQLQLLNCSHNQICDLSPLIKLKKLQYITCFGNEISNLSPLIYLPRLQFIDCGKNRIRDLSPIYSCVMSKKLNGLYVYDNPVSGIPSGVLGSNVTDNCLESLKNYWQDLANGKEAQRQLKVQFVGNGRVGKTTLAYVLKHKNTPSEPFQSTHGILIKEIQQRLESEDEPVTLQLWDFGGQEIYHATHRLFLSDDCLYLLLWAEETEEHPNETRHPVSYWLEAIHDLAPNSPVILVKNQIDFSDKQSGERPVGLDDNLPGADQIRHAVKVSAMTGRGMSVLRGAIEDVIRELKHRVCLELPSSWVYVQRELEQLKGQKTIPFAHFKQLCIKAGVSHAEWFAGYLHKTGTLFYREGTFQDQIILDQNWAINAVYRVFDPNQPHRRRIERMNGRFNGEDASLFWTDKETKEHEIYIDFMRNCGICYEPKRQQNRRDNTPFTEREFIIPALLPLTSAAKTAWGDSHPNDWQLDIEYDFLHRSIIERIILRIGETYEGEPWRTGIFCHTDEGQLLLECEYTNKQQSTQGQLRFQLRGNQLDRLVYALRKLVSETSPHRRYQEFLRKGTEERTELSEFKENPQMPTPLDENKPASKTIKLFISYAHEDEKPYREELDKRLKAIKRQYPMLEPWHDRNLLAGEQVHNKILQQLEVADIVVLLISPDFVDSDYCFSHEMEIALKQYEQNQNIVIPIIIRDTADWHTYQIGNHVALPTDGKPHSQWADKDAFWKDVQQGIRKQVENLLQT